MSGFHRRRTAGVTAVLISFLLGATLLAAGGVRCVHGSRNIVMQQQTTTTRVVVRTAAPATRLFVFLPRPRVIPPSGPSEGHNSIGLDDEGEKRVMVHP